MSLNTRSPVWLSPLPPPLPLYGIFTYHSRLLLVSLGWQYSSASFFFFYFQWGTTASSGDLQIHLSSVSWPHPMPANVLIPSHHLLLCFPQLRSPCLGNNAAITDHQSLVVDITWPVQYFFLLMSARSQLECLLPSFVLYIIRAALSYFLTLYPSFFVPSLVTRYKLQDVNPH